MRSDGHEIDDVEWPELAMPDVKDSVDKIIVKAKMGMFIRESQKGEAESVEGEEVELDQCKPTQGDELTSGEVGDAHPSENSAAFLGNSQRLEAKGGRS